MFEHKKIQAADDFFAALSDRKEKGVYFYRICQYNAQVGEFLRKYYDMAQRFGVVIEGKIPNPDEKNLAYYTEIVGSAFARDEEFILKSLQKWMPRMNGTQQKDVASSIYGILCRMQQEGKNEHIQKNAYIKFFCWLYYKFERAARMLGGRDVPKILYEGEISRHELLMLSVLSGAGADVVLLMPGGDGAYQSLDPQSRYCDLLCLPGMGAFPPQFGIRQLREDAQAARLMPQPDGGAKSPLCRCTNAWIAGNGLEDALKKPAGRGNDPNLFYNCFIRISGVWDKMMYQNDLYQFTVSIKNSGRGLVIEEKKIPFPSTEEIASVRRSSSTDPGQMLLELSANISYAGNAGLNSLMRQAFLGIAREAAASPGMNANKLMSRAVYLICWLKRYKDRLFYKWKERDVSCFIFFGSCANETEALFLRFLARLPVDVLILSPDLGHDSCVADDMLYEIHYTETMAADRFPADGAGLHIGTAAYHAQQELNTSLYRDTGLYRPQQYAKANAVPLATTYEEIKILWDQELKYRPNFSTIDTAVHMPVLFAKASGIKDEAKEPYWTGIKKLITQDTILVKTAPKIRPTDANPMKSYAAGFFKNGRLQREKIKTHPHYPYGFLREEMQEHILDKLELLISRKMIRGTFENGTEYTIISTVLNLGKEITRLLQKFDFTKKNPKMIFINTAEQMYSLEDASLAVFLSLAGFDILFFSPAGYSCIEQYLNGKIIEEHQVGGYVYDLEVPDFNNMRPSWREKFFRRER